MIKRFVFSLLLSVAIPIAAFPQVPQTMGYQGLLTDGSGVVVSDGSYSLTFKIYSVSTGGSALWTEVQGTVSTVNGVFNVILGSVTALNIAFDKTLYLEITIGSNVLTPRIELTGAPYAMNARAILTSASGNVGIGTTSPGQRLEVEVAGPAAIRVDNSSNSRATGLIAGVSGSALEFAVALFVQSNTYANVGTGVGTTRLYINGATGNVGIGTTTPGEILDVEASGATVAGFNRTTSDGTVISIQQAGVEEGTISVTTTTVSYNAFTGSHYAWTDTEIEKGVLVSLTGVNRGLHDDSESEVIYGITPTASVNDPRVMGSYLGLQESTQPMSVENPHLVMAVGNGAMWVVDNGRNIEIGDYLISSDVEGHAMVDPETFEVSHIVARVSEPIVWDEVAEEVEGRKHARITVFFESFTRNRKADRLENELVAVKARVDALEGMEGRLARLERMLATMMAEGKQSGQVSKYGE